MVDRRKIAAERTTDAEEELLDTIGMSFSKLRRRTMSAPVDPPVAPTDVRRDLLLSVLEESAVRPSVKAVAATLMMERSAASRLVTWCVEQGTVERVASQTDGRSITLRLTEHGRQVLRHSRHQQRQAFEYITRNWSRADQLEFARLLNKYAEDTASLEPTYTPAAGQPLPGNLDQRPAALQG